MITLQYLLKSSNLATNNRMKIHSFLTYDNYVIIDNNNNNNNNNNKKKYYYYYYYCCCCCCCCLPINIIFIYTYAYILTSL